MATATPNMTERRHLADRRTLDKSMSASSSTSSTLNAVDWLAMVLLIVGGINWGLIGLFGFDLVVALFGESRLSGMVYTLVGISALWCIYTCTKLASRQS
ncbi:MAG TPA: DUF378 domain-containing protein [Methylophilaceae bacterium]|nr:DUF378 domain-containing protein [Methylophilaceae bacterium]